MSVRLIDYSRFKGRWEQKRGERQERIIMLSHSRLLKLVQHNRHNKIYYVI